MFFCFAHVCTAQYFQFSQYNFTPSRINPAQVADSDYASVTLDYRNQATEGGFHLTSNYLNLSYPLLAKNGRGWSGLALSFMDDRSGQAGLFNTQEAGISYAINVPLTRFETLSLGVMGVYQSRKMDLGGLVTGAQYVPDRGFNKSLASGENIGQFKTDYITFSTGLYWQRVDETERRIAYAGISFFDFNKPANSFFGNESELNSTLVLSGGFRALQRDKLGLIPEVLYTRSDASNVLNVGFITRYDLNSDNKEISYLNIITKYVIGRSGIIGLQFFKNNLVIGASYDFPVFVTSVANTGAFEIAIGLRKLVMPPKGRNKRKKSARKPATAQTKPVQKSQPKPQPKDTTKSDTTAHSDTVKTETKSTSNNLSERLRQEQDSVITNTGVGRLKHEPLILERATLRFNFDFNSSSVNTETARYLDDLAQALVDNPALRIKLTGHTDNVGSEKFNMRLSLERAKAMRSYLIRKGVPESRITSEGKGMSEPLNGNKTAEEREVNRRVEVVIGY